MGQNIERGMRVKVRNADGAELTKVALTGTVMGDDFPVVWACREDEWAKAQTEGRDPEGLPWPAEDVTLVRV